MTYRAIIVLLLYLIVIILLCCAWEMILFIHMYIYIFNIVNVTVFARRLNKTICHEVNYVLNVDIIVHRYFNWSLKKFRPSSVISFIKICSYDVYTEKCILYKLSKYQNSWIGIHFIYYIMFYILYVLIYSHINLK